MQRISLLSAIFVMTMCIENRNRPRDRAYMLDVAEREGFEPSVGLYTLHSLSRRAPSADSAISPYKTHNGGGSRIRTHGPATNGATVFKTAALNHSAIPPNMFPSEAKRKITFKPLDVKRFLGFRNYDVHRGASVLRPEWNVLPLDSRSDSLLPGPGQSVMDRIFRPAVLQPEQSNIIGLGEARGERFDRSQDALDCLCGSFPRAG